MRYAYIDRRGEIPSEKIVAAYMPANYKVTVVTPERIWIAGNDNAGWTMQDYVIPRLASGIIYAREAVLGVDDPDQGLVPAVCEKHGATFIADAQAFTGFAGGNSAWWQYACGCQDADESDDVRAAR